MPERDDDAIERAYRLAVAATEDDAAAQRRRSAVLQAVRAQSAATAATAAAPRARHAPHEPHEPQEPAAANDARWAASAALWRGVAAACVIGATALVVGRLRDEPMALEPTHRPEPAPAAARTPAALPPRVDVPVADVPVVDAPAARAADATPRAATPQAPSMAPQMPRGRAEPAAFPDLDRELAATRGRAAAAAVTSAALAAADHPPAAPPAAPIAEAKAAAPAVSRLDAPAARALDADARTEPAPARARAGRADALARASSLRPEAPRLGDAAAPGPPETENLLTAAAAGDIDAVRRILQHTAPDAERDADGRTALALAVLRADLRMVQLLLASGANRLAPDRFGQTPQAYADAGGDPAVRRALDTR